MRLLNDRNFTFKSYVFTKKYIYIYVANAIKIKMMLNIEMIEYDLGNQTKPM